MSETNRQHLKQLFGYIRAVAERRFEMVQDYSDYSFSMELAKLPQHEMIDLPSFSEPDGYAVTDLILSVGKAEVPPCPQLPKSLIGWLETGYNEPTKEVRTIDSHEMPHPDSDTMRTELFSDDSARRADFETWIKEREAWALEALPAYNARKVYDRLYALYSELEREKDRLELMIGDGIFETVCENGTVIRHPIVVERVSLVFNSNVPCFTVSDSDSNPMLYSRLLRTTPQVESGCLAGFSEQIESELLHPFEVTRFDALLSSFANAISSECEFISENAVSDAKFTIKRGAVLFTRPRASGYSAILDRIIDDIDKAEEFSPSLLSIIGDKSDSAEVKVGMGAMEVNGIDSSVLLEKSANREQLLIAKKIAANPSVLVQGPPGTGKTHTIANIIGDLLAQGKSVLVSSQTSKALDVLRDKISEPIRPLCVSVLDDNRKQLEQALSAINDYMSSHNAESLDIEAEKISRERDALIEELAALKKRLIEIVELEYTPIALDGGELMPADAAKRIALAQENNYIPDSVPIESVLPLGIDELKNLYISNASLTKDEEALLSSGAPDSSELIEPARFERMCAIVSKTDEELRSAGVDYWRSDMQRDIAALSAVCEQARLLRERLSSAEEWKLRLAQSVVSGSFEGSVFELIEQSIPRLRDLAAQIKLPLIDMAPHIPQEVISQETGELFGEIVKELESEKINWLTIALHPKWKQLLDKCIINGEKPDTRSEVEILSKYHSLLIGRQTLLRRWSSAVSSLGGPELSGEAPEEQAAQAWTTVGGWLKFYSAEWNTFAAQLEALGFDMARYWEKRPLEERMEGEIYAARAAICDDLVGLIEDEYYRGDRGECIAALAGLSRMLLPFADDYPAAAAVRGAVESRDKDAYIAAYEHYDKITLKGAVYMRRMDAIERLSAVCPKWAAEISAREGLNGAGELPDDVSEKWLCARLRGELERRGAVKVSEIQENIEKLTAQLSGMTRELIARRAWSAQLRTMQDSDKKRNLATWAELVKRVGKGTGKRAEQLLASGELRRAMKECRRAVPVWIMPMSAVAEFFEPSDEKFDVLIIDEASQADITALISLYLAKKVIVVGDDKQVSPTPIGIDVETSAKLRQEFLEGIPGASMYDEMVSIYDLGKANYEPITLKEHFRCADDIINFSNYYTYNGIICPLRDSYSLKLHPATVAYRVEGGAAGKKKTNTKEALSVAALIKACTEQKEYDGATFGVITMLGDEQALVIDRLLREKLSESTYQSRKILCGNPSYFQGDERDVIFISLVDSSKGDGKALATRREGYNEMYSKRYNVAASRARDQLWVVHSLDPERDLKGDDIRLSLIRHAQEPSATAEALYKEQPAALSAMENAVAKILTDGGYNVVPRKKVGTYTVGLCCEGGGGRIAIECDGDISRDAEKIADELNKQSVLERLGWRFIRLRAWEYYRSPEDFANALLDDIAARGLKPSAKVCAQKNGSLLEKVIQRAEKLMSEWDSAAEKASKEVIESGQAEAPSDEQVEQPDVQVSEQTEQS